MNDEKEVREKLRKPLLLLCFLIVAIFSIYVIYYYSKRSSFTSTILVDTDTTANIEILPFSNASADFSKTLVYSYIFPKTLMINAQSLVVEGAKMNLPDEGMINPGDFISAAGLDHQALQDSVNDRISRKFANHPPVELESKAVGWATFSYLLKRVNLPPGFRKAELIYEGEKVNGFFWQSNAPDGEPVSLFRNDSISVAVISFGEQEEMWLVRHSNPLSLWQIFNTAKSLKGEGDTIAPSRDEPLIFPLLDFAIAGSYTNVPNTNLAHAKQMVKMSVSGASKDLVVEPPESPWMFHNPFFFCLKRKDAPAPYLMMWVGNDALLHMVRAHGKKSDK